VGSGQHEQTERRKLITDDWELSTENWSGAMTTLWQDVRYAVRMVARSPGFTAVVVVILAVGTGATTAMFSVINAVLLRPLPIKDVDRLVMMWETNRERPDELGGVVLLRFLEWQKRCTTLEHMAFFYDRWELTLAGAEDTAQLVGMPVDPEFFSVVGVQPVLGRTFLPEEARENGPPVVILSHSAWQRFFGGDAQWIGRTTILTDFILGQGRPYTIVGVMPAGFRLFDAPEFFLPFPMDIDGPGRKGGLHAGHAIGRLKSGVTRLEAQAELETIRRPVEGADAAKEQDRGARLTSLHEHLVRNVRWLLYVLQGATLLVLLVAASNVANLLLARSASRGKEMAVRLSLGGGRGRLIRQLLTESLLLAVLGGMLGLFLAYWGIAGLGKLAVGFLPRVQEVHLDLRVLAFAGLVSLGSGLSFGLMPALRGTKTDLSEHLKEAGAGRGTGTSRPGRLRQALVVAQIALSLVLLAGAGLFLKSFLRLHNVRLGFDPRNTLIVELGGPIFRPLGRELLERVSALPGVEAVGAVTHLPPERAGRTDDVTVPGQATECKACYQAATPGYFRAMGISVVRGRGLTEQDIRGSAPVVVVNETFVERYLEGVDPIGRQIGDDGTRGKRHTIVGVVKDVVNRTLRQEVQPELYYSAGQEPFWTHHLVVRTQSEPMALAASVREVVKSLQKDRPVLSVQTMAQRIGTSMVPERFQTILVSLFSGVGLILAAVGIYGVMSYVVAQRIREFGIRMALGAPRGNILQLVVRQALWLVGIGLALGLAGAVAFTRVLRTLLFQVEPLDLPTFISVSIFLAAVALLACYLPARRAARIDPMTALRYE
jgi:putative ABC transport system permease protein